jgi:hypothetical protein
MALSTYSELKKSIESWATNPDAREIIPDFIALAETEMYNNEQAILKLSLMETISTAVTASSDRIALPDNIEKLRSVRIVSPFVRELEFRTPEQLTRTNSTGRPIAYSIIGNELQFDLTPNPAYTIEMQYYKRPAPLSDTNPTNEVLTNFPTIYIYGSLHQLFLWSEEDEQAVKYFQKFISAIKGANRANKALRYGVAPRMINNSVV